MLTLTFIHYTSNMWRNDFTYMLPHLGCDSIKARCLHKGKYASTDLVGQVYLNSDWAESFPSDSGLVYPVGGREGHL